MLRLTHHVCGCQDGPAPGDPGCGNRLGGGASRVRATDHGPWTEGVAGPDRVQGPSQEHHAGQQVRGARGRIGTDAGAQGASRPTSDGGAAACDPTRAVRGVCPRSGGKGQERRRRPAGGPAILRKPVSAITEADILAFRQARGSGRRQAGHHQPRSADSLRDAAPGPRRFSVPPRSLSARGRGPRPMALGGGRAQGVRGDAVPICRDGPAGGSDADAAQRDPRAPASGCRSRAGDRALASGEDGAAARGAQSGGPRDPGRSARLPRSGVVFPNPDGRPYSRAHVGGCSGRPRGSPGRIHV
jgi:hypothetical protein